jgi:hypothetical protein
MWIASGLALTRGDLRATVVLAIIGATLVLRIPHLLLLLVITLFAGKHAGGEYDR